MKFRAGLGPSGGLGNWVALFSAPNDLAVAFDKMAAVAPSDIEPDIKAMRDAFRKQYEGLGEAATNPGGAALGGLVQGLAASGSFNRVDQWLGSNCSVELERLRESIGVPSTTSAPLGEIGFDDDIDCSKGEAFVDRGPSQRVTATFTDIRGLVTVSVVAKDANGKEVARTSIKGPDIDGTGGVGELSFDVPAGGFSLEYNTGGNLVSTCDAHLVIRTQPTAGRPTSPDPAEPSVPEGAIAATVDVGTTGAKCAVQGSYFVITDPRSFIDSENPDRIRFFDASGERKASYGRADLSEIGDPSLVLAGVDGSGKPLIAALTSKHTPSVGLTPAVTTSKLVLFDPVQGRVRWAIDESPSPLAVIGSVLIAINETEGTVLGLNLADGTTEWSLQSTGAAMSVDGRYVVASMPGDQKVLIDPASGDRVASIAVRTGSVQVLADGFYAVRDGYRLFVYGEEGPALRSYPAGLAGGDLLSSDGVLVSLVNGEGLKAHELTTGDVLWALPDAQVESVNFQLQKVSKDVLFGTTSSGLVMVSLKDGSQLRVFEKGAGALAIGTQVGSAYMVCGSGTRGEPARVFRSATEPLGVVGNSLIRQ